MAGDAGAHARVKELLAGLGFRLAAEQPVDSLSGGWRMRLNLARALVPAACWTNRPITSTSTPPGSNAG
jgi:ATPase subunit of ABC transporter with duplicated ATPase domains